MEITPELYHNDQLYPTVDRPKPHYPSTLFDQHGGCDYETAELECPAYAYNACLHLWTDEGFSGDYLECLDQKFTACRNGAGCNYRNVPTAESCRGCGKDVSELVEQACSTTDFREFSSENAQLNCVERVERMSAWGCGNIPAHTYGPVQNFWYS